MLWLDFFNKRSYSGNVSVWKSHGQIVLIMYKFDNPATEDYMPIFQNQFSKFRAFLQT